LYRSARPDDGTLRDRNTLKDEYGIRTVMDLRTKYAPRPSFCIRYSTAWQTTP